MSQNRHLVEPASELIVTYIQNNIAAALTNIRADRNTPINYGIPTPPPQEYFISKPYMALLPPSIFVICDSIDFKKERGANFIFATAKYGIAAINEGLNTDIVTRSTWRYQAALSQILDNLHLTSSDNTFRINIIVRGAKFSEEYDTSSQGANPAKRWRKGVLLECDVEFYEDL